MDEDAGFVSSAWDSLLMGSVTAGRNLEREAEESLRRTMRDLVVVVDFLGRAPPLGVEGEALCALAMVRVGRSCEGRVWGWRWRGKLVLCTCV